MRTDVRVPSDGAPAPSAAILDDPAPTRSRRALLAAAVGGVAGALASALGRPAGTQAAVGDPLILGQQNFAGNSATRLSATSSGGAFWMTQNGSGSGVRGESWNGTGGVFETHHPDRQGLLAQQLGTAGTGAAVRAVGGTNKGVYGTSSGQPGVLGESSSGEGVRGSSSSHIGVYGISNTWTGVAGYSTSGAGVAGTGSTYGVLGTSTNSTAVQGVSNAATGVNGESDTWVGVRGHSNSYVGVLGESGSSVGVYGYTGNPDTSSAGYFEGPLNATEKNFRIDHPLDPANRILVHSCVESNERKLVYDGVVTTDESGEATIQLPDWFAALNTDVRYQLTVIGSFGQAIVKSELKANRFAIATSEPNLKVCWQVTGVRQDAYAKAHPLVVERAKARRERGKYLNPVEHGQPESAGIGFELRRRAAAVRPTEAAGPPG